MRLRPFFMYFGAKYRIAPRYPRPRYGRLVEPFAGSAGYSVRHHTLDVELYDVNPKVVGTWEYLTHATQREIMQLPLDVPDARDLDECQEARWLIGWWLNKGAADPRNLRTRWSAPDGPRPDSAWGVAIRERIARQLPAIRHWRVRLASYEEIPDYRATWFVDPPYQGNGRAYPFHDVDYERLRGWVEGRWGQTIVCGERGDDWLPFRHLAHARSMTRYEHDPLHEEMIWTRLEE